MPVVVVMGKTCQSRKATLIPFLLALFPLPFLLPSAILFEQLQFAVYLLCGFFEGMKMALDFLLGLYAFLFVVVALFSTVTFMVFFFLGVL